MIKILIVDRVKLFFEIVSENLSNHDVSITRAESGKVAEKLISNQKFDFIACALHLDDTDAVSLCRMVRDYPQYLNTPFVILSTESAKSVRKKAFSSGVTDVFSKTSVDEFTTFVLRIVRKHQALTGRILYIEDSKAQREAITSMLVSRGLLVDGFSNGDHAWESFKEQEYDLVITDIVLEGDISGVTLANQIRRIPGDKGDTPILAVTGYDNSSRKIGLLHLGVNDYITKPVVEEELFARLKNLLAVSKNLKEAKHDLVQADNELMLREQERSAAEHSRMELARSQEALLSITRSTILNLNLKDYLGVIFGILSTVDFLDTSIKGAIYLKNLKNGFIPAAGHNTNEEDINLYSEVIQQHKASFQSRNSNVVFVKQASAYNCYLLPLKSADSVIGVMVIDIMADYKDNFTATKFMLALSEIMSSLIYRRMSDEALAIQKNELEFARDGFVQKLGQISEFRDSETGLHIIRMSKYAAIIGKYSGADSQYCEQLEKSAPMHDVGKIAIPDNILKKPGKLTPDEFEIMKTHSTAGFEILSGRGELLEMAAEIAVSHHEKWDGSGYPSGLAGKNIPLSGRICAIADVFDALTMERPYKEPWPVEKAKQLIIDSSGTHFDPDLVSAFVRGFPEILHLKSLYSEETINPRAVLPPTTFENKDALIQWNDDYSVGIDIIDAHHQYLFNAINDLHEAIVKNHDAGRISKTLRILEDYTYIHFREEEKMMERMGYPHLERHKKLHKAFENKISEFQQELLYNPLALSTTIIEYLNSWLVNHICKIDSQIVNECNKVKN